MVEIPDPPGVSLLWTLEKARANVVERAVVLTEPPADLGMKSSRKGQ